MSHYTKLSIQAQQKYEAELIMALQEHFGENGVEVYDTPKTLDSWSGGPTAEKAEIIVRKKTLSAKAKRDLMVNDLGYRRNNNDGYDVIVDEAGFSKANQDLVAQYYAAKVAEKKLRAQGYSVAHKKLDSGQIQLTAQMYR